MPFRCWQASTRLVLVTSKGCQPCELQKQSIPSDVRYETIDVQTMNAEATTSKRPHADGLRRRRTAIHPQRPPPRRRPTNVPPPLGVRPRPARTRRRRFRNARRRSQPLVQPQPLATPPHPRPHRQRQGTLRLVVAEQMAWVRGGSIRGVDAVGRSSPTRST